MGYYEDAPERVHEETRAVLCRGYAMPPGKVLGDALSAWTRTHGGGAGDMSLQLIAHCEDLASDWQDRPLIVGVFMREVFGLDDDHRLGLTAGELAKRVRDADARLDPLEASLRELAAGLGVEAPARQSLFTWGGPLCSARLVKGVWRDEAEDDEYYWSVDEGKPAFYFCRAGGSQDQAPGGAFGFELASGVYDNSTPPFELTPELLGATDAALAKHGIVDARLYVFSHYD